MELSDELALLGSWASPYAQRTCIALEEKGANYRLQEISLKDLFGKPAWFLDVNSAGLIPVLAYLEDGKRRVVTESLICIEFVDEFMPGPSLMPDSAYGKAHARAIIARFESKLLRSFWRYLVQQDDPKITERARADVDGELKWLSGVLQDTGGPFLLGKNMSLLDCAVIPFLTKLYLLEHYRGYQLPESCSNLVEYVDFVTRRPSVAETMKAPNGLNYKTEIIGIMATVADGTSPSLIVTAAKQ